MKAKKLLRKYEGGKDVDVMFYKSGEMIDITSTRYLFSHYPLDEKTYVLLNSKVKSFWFPKSYAEYPHLKIEIE